MRAIVVSRFGGPEVLEERDVEAPKAGPGELLVRVVASATNPVEAKVRQDGRWAGLEPPFVTGYDASGVVEQVGPGVSGFQAGDEVFYSPELHGNRWGTHAELNAVPAAIVAKKPATLSHEEAAAIPLAGGTAWEAVVRRLRPIPGETLLVHGGAGGVGSFAVQFAKACGARVLATASSQNLATLRELGADVAIDYRAEDVAQRALAETGGRGVDAVMSCVGGATVLQSLSCLRPFGRIATILGVDGDLMPLYRHNQTLHGVFLTRERARLEEMTPLFERGQARVLLGEVLPMSDVRRAHERLDSGHGRGKLVLRVGG